MGMSRRQRAKANINVRSNQMHWIVVQTSWRHVIESNELPPGTDLFETYLESMLKYHRSGWSFTEFSSYNAHFFVSKDGEHRVVQITPEDPSKPQAFGVTP